jgi:nucleotide-binding universal stress UspA family protein
MTAWIDRAGTGESPATPVALSPRHTQILLCTDGSPAMDVAERYAQLLSRSTGAALEVAHVVAGPSPAYEALGSEVEAHATDLGATCRLLRPEQGDGHRPSRPLVRYLSEGAGAGEVLVVVSSHGRRALTRAVLGSLTDDVLRETGRPVLVVGPDAVPADRIPRVAACTDGSDLAAEIVPAAAGLAAELGVPLWIVAVQDPAAPLPAGGDVVDAGSVESLARTVPGDVEVAWDVLHGGSAAAAITEFARQEPGTVIALASHGRGGLAAAVAGSVAQAVIRAAEGPVLVLRPSGSGR